MVLRDLYAPIAMPRWVLCFSGLVSRKENPGGTLHPLWKIIKRFVYNSEKFLCTTQYSRV